MPITPNDISLYGLNEDLSTHLKKLDAAMAFSQIRRDIDRNITTLKTLTPATFSKRRVRDQFRHNVELVVTGDRGGRALLPLLNAIGTMADDRFLNYFILGCYTLTETMYKNLAKNGLVGNFAEFFVHVVKECLIFTDLREKLLSVIMDICRENSNETSNVLLGVIERVRRNRPRLDSSGSQLSDVIEGVRTKRPRLAPSASQRSDDSSSEDEEGPLVLGPEVPADVEVTHSDAPPDHFPKRVVFQFLSGRIGRLKKILWASPFLQAIKASKQWRWERERDRQLGSKPKPRRTDTIIALIPDSEEQDISFVIRAGHQMGSAIIRYLEFQASQADE